MASLKHAPSLPSNHPTQRRKWIPEEILQLNYFHIDIPNSDAATSLLKNQGNKVGTFLLRRSSKGQNYLSLSVSVAGGHIHHVQVNVLMRNGRWSYFIVPEVVFTVFEELRVYYSQHRIGNLENVENVKLLIPLAKQRARTVSLPAEAHGMSFQLQDHHRKKSEIRLNRRSETSMDSQGSENRYSGSSLEDHEHLRILPNLRPPQPLPFQNRSQGGSDTYYSRTNDEDVNRAGELQELLRSTERCDCGLQMSDAELGNGWAVHKSRDALTLGKLFFQNAEGDTTWVLPETVLCKLMPSKMEFLVNLYRKGNQKVPFDENTLKQLNVAMMF